jgi:hypothetical protein
MIDRIEIRKKIPYGYGKLIAKKAGVSTRFLSKYLNNSEVNSERVEMAVLETLADLSQKKKTLLAQIN